MVLNFFLVSVADVLYFGAGIKGVHFLGSDSIIDGFVKAAEEATGYRPTYPNWSAMVVLTVTFVWIYLSIVKVFRVALKLQAAFFVVSVLVWLLWIGPLLMFSVQNLNPLFSLLVTLSFVLTIALVTDFAIALWNVSRSPENSSFIATLDPRLAPGWWTYLNKLLDLPRTPLRNWRTAAAYALAVAGAILLITSIMYLMMFGGVTTRLFEFFFKCGPAEMAACAAQSLVLSQHILLFLGLSLVGLKAAALLQSGAKRLGGLSISDVVRNPNDRFVLYLRPFGTDDVVLPKPRLPFWTRLLSLRPFPARIEDELFDVTDGYRPLIAIGNPSKSGEQLGGMAYRAYVDDAYWQDYVLDKVQRAESIVMVLRDTEGVRWELALIVSGNAAYKTLFLFDPSAKDAQAWQALVAWTLPPFKAAGLVAPDFAFQDRPIGFYFDMGELVEIENVHWTATSYRTAFSHFLSLRASLILARASTSRPSGEWSDDDYEVLADGAVVGRIMRAADSPNGTPWLWTLTFGQHDRTPAHGYAATREAAMAAFAKSWRLE